MKIAQTCLICLLTLQVASAQPEERAEANGLRIHAVRRYLALTTVSSGEPREAAWAVEIVVLLENVGKSELSIPTMLPGKEPNGVLGPDIRMTSFDFAMEEWYGRKIIPSSTSFEPVVIRPGEVAGLPIWRKTIVADEREEQMRDFVCYSVSTDLGERFGWWSGELCVATSEESNEHTWSTDQQEDANSGGGKPGGGS